MDAEKAEFSPEKAPQFDKTLLDTVHRHVDPEKWDKVSELYEKKQYRDVVTGILDYVDSDLMDRTGNEEKTRFDIPHGSAVVHLSIENQQFQVTAPFLTLPTTHNVPLLRQVAQINIFPLNLSTISLEEDRLIFKYSCPLELCEPYKIYNVLREICAYADAYDDEFITKFNAIRVHKPNLKPFSDENKDKAWKQVQAYIAETVRYVDYFEKKRMVELCVDMITIALMKIDYYTAPQGILRTDIEKTVSLMQDQDIPVTDKIRKGKERIDSLKNYNPQNFKKALYTAEMFIPLKFNFTNEMIDPYFQAFYEPVQNDIANRNYIGAVTTLQTAFLNLFYHYIFPDDVQEILTDALTESRGKSWEKAAIILKEALENVLNRDKTKRKKGLWGFFSRGKK